MKHKITTWALVALAWISVACQPVKAPDYITLSSDKTINAEWKAKTYDVVFTANTAWTATCKADAGEEFFSLNRTSGNDGTIALTLSVTENTVDATRTGTITITAGSATETIKVNQDPVGETSEERQLSVNFLPQTVKVATSAKATKAESNQEWAQVSEIQDDGVVFNIAENGSGAQRSAFLNVMLGKHTIKVILKQEPESGTLSNPKVSYLGHKVHIYDSENGYSKFGQYQLAFDSEYGKVNLVVNANPASDPTTVPTGLYAVDASGKYDDKTFTVSGDYPTCFSIDGTDYAVIDGEISIQTEGDGYKVKATLQDAAEKIHVYTYTGALGTVAKDDMASVVDGKPSYSNYYTYFAGNNYIWSITLFYSAAPSANAEYVSWVTFKVVKPAGESTEFPTGTFSYKAIDTNSASTGYVETTVGTFDLSGNTLEQNGFRVNSGALIISKKDDKYTFSLRSNLTTYTNYNEQGEYVSTPIDLKTFDWNPNTTFAIPAAGPGSMATPDTDVVTFNTNPTPDARYVGNWFGHLYGTNPDGEGGNPAWNAFFFGWTNAQEYTIYLSVNTDVAWTYEKNFSGRFCNTPIPAGTYTFSNEPGPQTLLPTKSRCYFKNNYTGTTYRINGGSITLTDTHITFNNVTGMQTSTGKVCTFKGEFDTTCYYHQDRSTNATQKAAMEIVPVQGPAQ